MGAGVIGRNVVQYGARNAAINLTTQMVFSGNIGEIDVADVVFSSISGNSFVFSSLASAMVDYDANGLQTTLNKGFYRTSVDILTGTAFGYLGGQAGVAIGTKGGSYAVESTIDGIGGLFNWTLSQKPDN